MRASFRSVSCPPPTGEFFLERDGDRISARTWAEFFPKVVAFMRKHGLSGAPEDVVADHMCPYLPDWYCNGGGYRQVTMKEARDGAERYFGMHVVPYDAIIRRLAACRACPMHDRSVCLTCTGALDWIASRFGRRRHRIPDDVPSGICRAAKTFESVVATVDLRGCDAVWDGCPDTCWRNKP